MRPYSLGHDDPDLDDVCLIHCGRRDILVIAQLEGQGVRAQGCVLVDVEPRGERDAGVFIDQAIGYMRVG